MSKTLICIDNLDAHICCESRKLYMDSTKILTAGARDELIRRGIGIVYGSVPECNHEGRHGGVSDCAALLAHCSHAANAEEVVFSVAAMLKKDYGINDPEELKALSLCALKTIKDNM